MSNPDEEVSLNFNKMKNFYLTSNACFIQFTI